MNPAGAVATDYDVSWGMGRDNGRDAAELLPLEGVQRFVINNWKSKPPDFLWLRINLINRLWLLLRLLVNWNAKKYEFVKNIESRIFHYLLFALLRHFICQYCRPPDQPSLIFASKELEDCSKTGWVSDPYKVITGEQNTSPPVPRIGPLKLLLQELHIQKLLNEKGITDLDVESLWTRPCEAAEFLHLDSDSDEDVLAWQLPSRMERLHTHTQDCSSRMMNILDSDEWHIYSYIIK